MTDPVDTAKRAIAQALEQLERETGSVVREIGVSRWDATTVGDSGRRYRMSVDIELERLPAHEWQT